MYDASVVGAGVGGLTTAGLLAKGGKRVAVFERHHTPGGYAQAFTRKGVAFDSSIHLTSGCRVTDNPNSGVIFKLLATLGVEGECEFIPVSPFYSVRFPDFSMDIPSGVPAFIDAVAARFPSERSGLEKLMAKAETLRRIIRAYPLYPSVFTHLTTPFRFPSLIRFGKRSLKEALDHYLTDEECKAVVASLWSYLATPPESLSFALWSGMTNSYLDEGGYCCKSTFQSLVSALVHGVERHGGKVHTSRGVDRILVEGGSARGVVLQGGEMVRAPCVVSNVDLRETCEGLLQEGDLPRAYREQVSGMKPSVSAFTVYGVTDLDVNRYLRAYETICYDSIDHDKSQRRIEAGDISVLFITIPSLYDPSSAPAGKHALTLTTLAGGGGTDEEWRLRKRAFTDRIIAHAESVLPGLGDHFEVLAAASPATYRRYTGNQNGAMVGWASLVNQVGQHRPGPRTPVDGLYIAGHWCRPAGGLFGVVLAGFYAAQNILGHSNIKKLLRSLETG